MISILHARETANGRPSLLVPNFDDFPLDETADRRAPDLMFFAQYRALDRYSVSLAPHAQLSSLINDWGSLYIRRIRALTDGAAISSQL
jgi:hypothetical protein